MIISVEADIGAYRLVYIYEEFRLSECKYAANFFPIYVEFQLLETGF